MSHSPRRKGKGTKKSGARLSSESLSRSPSPSDCPSRKSKSRKESIPLFDEHSGLVSTLRGRPSGIAIAILVLAPPIIGVICSSLAFALGRAA